MTIKEQIVEKFRACGYDMFIACEQADAIIKEFKVSGVLEKSWGIMGEHGKCLDVVTLRRKFIRKK